STILRQRLLHDIHELRTHPYPGIDFQIHDEDALSKACLILTPAGDKPLHLTIKFPENYPLEPPIVYMDSRVIHPNVFDDYVCASILNSREAYTSAYTLKGISIQLLSFFSSDTVEQEELGSVNIKDFAMSESGTCYALLTQIAPDFTCTKCRFGLDLRDTLAPDAKHQLSSTHQAAPAKAGDVNLPAEIQLMLCDHMDDETLFVAARAWSGFETLIRNHNIVRRRELQCFTTKKNFRDVILGVGVSVGEKNIHSEFDLISEEAFFTLRIRDSVHGIAFGHWLPLPIAETHWARVKTQINLDSMLRGMYDNAGTTGPLVNVVYTIMNDTVVRLSNQASGNWMAPSASSRLFDQQKSTLKHASERAVEAYFHLYHLLLCLATERPGVAKAADDLVNAIKSGKTFKTDCPNLGHLLTAMLISNVPITEEIVRSVIKEAITRNVVWMLDARGANLPELSFLEAEDGNDYRLEQTFKAGLTTYTLLMFQRLMQRTVAEARMKNDGSKMTLEEMKAALFRRHGAPPHG
ncbi:hypothetical protein EJ03DRAFT_252118, partial [Teratosphaeria nubilosa]